MTKYYIVELTENVGKSCFCHRNYSKGVRVVVWEDTILGCYWTANTNDTFPVNCAKKIYEFVKNRKYKPDLKREESK